MAIPPISNAGSDYFNTNQCRTFGMGFGSSSLTCLSSVDVGGYGVGQPCSEVTVYCFADHGGAFVTIYDKNNAGDAHGWILGDNDQFTFRGITNVNEVSAICSDVACHIEYRAQFFSNNPR